MQNEQKEKNCYSNQLTQLGLCILLNEDTSEETLKRKTNEFD